MTSPQATVASLEVALTAADQAALVYTSSPAADPVVKSRIKTAAQVAYDAIKAAEANASAGNIAAVQGAILSLQGAIPK